MTRLNQLQPHPALAASPVDSAPVARLFSRAVARIEVLLIVLGIIVRITEAIRSG